MHTSAHLLWNPSKSLGVKGYSACSSGGAYWPVRNVVNRWSLPHPSWE